MYPDKKEAVSRSRNISYAIFSVAKSASPVNSAMPILALQHRENVTVMQRTQKNRRDTDRSRSLERLLAPIAASALST